MERKKFLVADTQQEAKNLKAGEMILLSGTVYTARDAAHKRMMALLDEGSELPFPMKGAAIYYAGPTPAPEGMPIGSCGPTTSGRMDPFAPRLLDLGLSVMRFCFSSDRTSFCIWIPGAWFFPLQLFDHGFERVAALTQLKGEDFFQRKRQEIEQQRIQRAQFGNGFLPASADDHGPGRFQ